MSAAKHTPGPWRWRGGTGEDYAALVSDMVGGPIIQTTHDVDPENPNAKLIAAAPALADALEALLASVAEMTAPPTAGHPLTRTDRDELESREREAIEGARVALRSAGRLP